MQRVELPAASRAAELDEAQGFREAANKHFTSILEGLRVPYRCSRTFFSWPRLLGKSTRPSGLLPESNSSFSPVSLSLPLLAAGLGRGDVIWDGCHPGPLQALFHHKHGTLCCSS